MQIEFGCRCGAVGGVVSPAQPSLSIRVTCYCDDCQAFAHYLGRADLLDARGGSDIVQVPPASVTFTRGWDQIDGVRLGVKGLYRWRARCCQSPLGNTATPAIPFVGLPASSFLAEGAGPDAVFGKPRGAIMGQFAIGGAPPGTKGIPLKLMASTIARVLGWRLRGRTWPHPFFDRETVKPLYSFTTLEQGERERLRRLCGPRPAEPVSLA